MEYTHVNTQLDNIFGHVYNKHLMMLEPWQGRGETDCILESDASELQTLTLHGRRLIDFTGMPH